MEGSTRLLSRLGPEYVLALDAQRRILRDAWAEYGGTELGTEGDSFFVAFDNAPSAVRAAVAGQRGMLDSEWPSGERVLVRMGLHTGSPMRHQDGYVGMDVHRAARVAGVAQGGQILVSDATAALAGSERSGGGDGFGFLDLGLHQLKDLPQPEHLFQVIADGLPQEFALVPSLGSVTNLPPAATPIVGREDERAQLSALLAEPAVRLVTLTGPGGSGKTRLATDLAIRTASSFPHGVYFVGLESVRAADDMWTEIATTLDVPPEARLRPALLEHIAHKSSLLVLDNLEQVDGAGDVVKELLEAAPSFRVVATSRHPLHAPGEHEFPVSPLALPETTGLSAVEASPAVQLFIRQARLVRPSFRLTDENRSDIAAVCTRLDGLPLALELAAARSKLLAPKALLKRLDEALDLRSPELGRSDRQQTLRHTITWSYELLDPVERRLFQCLSVFAGGAGLDSVESVWAQLPHGPHQGHTDVLPLLERLVDASLAVVGEGPDDEPRIEMLNTVQAFAVEQLAASGDEDLVSEAAVRHFEELMQDPDRDGDFEARHRYLARLEVEHDNFRRCLEWLLMQVDRDGTEERTIRMLTLTARLVGRLCRPRGYYTEGRRWCERALAATTLREDVSVAAVEIELASILGTCGEREAAVPILEHADGVLASTVPDERVNEDTLERLRSVLLIGQAMAAHTMGQTEKARELYEKGLATFRDPLRRGHLLHNYAAMIGATEGPAMALEYERQTAELFRQAGDENSWVFASHNAACSLRELGRPEEARQEMAALFPRVVATRIPEALFVVAEDYASVMSDLGRFAETALLIGAATAMRERIGVPVDPPQELELEEPVGRARAALGDEWHTWVERGRGLSVEQAVQETEKLQEERVGAGD
jgi:predicted ATPase